jgi:hypothetical protein
MEAASREDSPMNLLPQSGPSIIGRAKVFEVWEPSPFGLPEPLDAATVKEYLTHHVSSFSQV